MQTGFLPFILYCLMVVAAAIVEFMDRKVYHPKHRRRFNLKLFVLSWIGCASYYIKKWRLAR